MQLSAIACASSSALFFLPPPSLPPHARARDTLARLTPPINFFASSGGDRLQPDVRSGTIWFQFSAARSYLVDIVDPGCQGLGTVEAVHHDRGVTSLAVPMSFTSSHSGLNHMSLSPLAVSKLPLAPHSIEASDRPLSDIRTARPRPCVLSSGRRHSQKFLFRRDFPIAAPPYVHQLMAGTSNFGSLARSFLPFPSSDSKLPPLARSLALT